MIDRNDPCWCGNQKKWKKCHWPTLPTLSKRDYWKKHQIYIKDSEQIDKIRKACHLSASILDQVAKEAKPGVTTRELDNLARELTKAHGAISASYGYGYPPFPAVLCTSINEVICHGIPDDRPLVEGDILNIDYACSLDGFFGDCSKMVAIGEVSEPKKRVMDVCLKALNSSIEILKPGIPVSAIGEVISEIASQGKLSVVEDFVGHGVGILYHEELQVPHCRNQINLPLSSGMIFTIEPMLNVGRKEGVTDSIDRWTVRTIDGLPSAQWEHTILITDQGYEVLTPWTP